MKQLNLSKMSAENRLIYELTWARIAATATQDEIDIKNLDAERIKKALKLGKLTNEEIAEINDVSLDFVLDVKEKMSQK